MFNCVTVMSRAEAEKYSKSRHFEKSAIISIRALDEDEPNIKIRDYNNIMAIEFTWFNDVDTEENGGITVEDSERLARFIKEMTKRDDIERLIVHCGAGQSRSAGVAAAISKYLFNDDERFFREKTPNRRCYRLVLEALNYSE